jgi:hypothetical protein
MNEDKKLFAVATLVVFVGVTSVVGGRYFFAQKRPTSSVPISIPGGVADLGPSTYNDPAFFDLNYRQVSSLSLGKGEKTVVYQYPDSPCGTLMTQFSGIGSVRVGRGPVYTLASRECTNINKTYVPNDFSFRTYACENVPISAYTQTPIAHATFAFQCSPPNEDSRCSEARMAGMPLQQDWNCGNY